MILILGCIECAGAGVLQDWNGSLKGSWKVLVREQISATCWLKQAPERGEFSSC